MVLKDMIYLPPSPGFWDYASWAPPRKRVSNLQYVPFVSVMFAVFVPLSL